MKVVSEKGFEISNNTEEDFDLSDWLIKLADGSTLAIPSLSLVASKSSITIPFSSFGISSYSGQATLMTPQWVEVNSSEKEKVVSPPLKTNSYYYDKTPSVLGVNTTQEQESFALEAKDLQDNKTGQNKSYTKIIFFSVALVLVIILFIVLEKRFGLEKEE